MFNKENVGIVNCNKAVAVEAFRKGLVRDNPLYASLTKTIPVTMIEALAWANKYINLEEDKRQEKQKRHRDGRREKAAITMAETRVERTRPQRSPKWEEMPSKGY